MTRHRRRPARVLVALYLTLLAAGCQQSGRTLPDKRVSFYSIARKTYGDGSLWIAVAVKNPHMPSPLRSGTIVVPPLEEARSIAESVHRRLSYDGLIPSVPRDAFDGWGDLDDFSPELERWILDVHDTQSPDGRFVIADRKWSENDEGRNWSLWLVDKKKGAAVPLVSGWENGEFVDFAVCFAKDSLSAVYRIYHGGPTEDGHGEEYYYSFVRWDQEGKIVTGHDLKSRRRMNPFYLLGKSLDDCRRRLK